jgi:hypothetical protein
VKKFVLVLALAAGGFFGYQYFFRPEHRACAKWASLCDESDDEVKTCEQGVRRLGTLGGASQAMALASCMSDANSCAAGTGCFVGAGLSAGGSAVGDFFKGLGNALKK